MVVRGYIAGVENSASGWKVKLQLFPGVDAAAEDRWSALSLARLQLFPGVDAAAEDRLHGKADDPLCVYLRLPCSEGEARKWGAVAGSPIDLTLALDHEHPGPDPGTEVGP